MPLKLTTNYFNAPLEVEGFSFAKEKECIVIHRVNADNPALPPFLRFAMVDVDEHDLEFLPELETPLHAWKAIMVGGGVIFDRDHYRDFENLKNAMRRLYGIKAELQEWYEDEDENSHICYYPINIAGRSNNVLTLTADKVVHHIKLEAGIVHRGGTRPIKILAETYYPPQSPATYRKSEWHLSVPGDAQLNAAFIAEKVAELS